MHLYKLCFKNRIKENSDTRFVYLLKYNPIYELMKLRTKNSNKYKLYTPFVNFSLFFLSGRDKLQMFFVIVPN